MLLHYMAVPITCMPIQSKKDGIDATFVDPECTTEELNAVFKENTKVVFGENHCQSGSCSIGDLEKLASCSCTWRTVYCG